jgi:hypothetical protein
VRGKKNQFIGTRAHGQFEKPVERVYLSVKQGILNPVVGTHHYGRQRILPEYGTAEEMVASFYFTFGEREYFVPDHVKHFFDLFIVSHKRDPS